MEKLFRPVNLIIEPARIDELEAFNNIWLEAFDYHLGQAGRLSETVKEIVKNYETGGPQAKETMQKVLKEILANMKRKMKLSWFKTLIFKICFKLTLKKIPTEKECGLYKAPLDDELKLNVKNYIHNYILKRYQKDKAEELHLKVAKDIPVPFTFVFGHTHRPLMKAEELAEAEIIIDKLTYPILNTGGWIRSDDETSNGEDAGVLVLNEKGAEWKSLAGQLR